MYQLTLILVVVLLALTTLAQGAELRLPSLFTEHMVLQQGRAVPVWGHAAPGEQVVVRFNRQGDGNRGGRWVLVRAFETLPGRRAV